MNPHYAEVAQRAAHRCEFCRAPEAIFNLPFEVEHVIPLSREGLDDAANLALACRACNLHKADHLTGVDEATHKKRHSLPRARRKPGRQEMRSGP